MITSSDSSLYWKRITIPKGLPALLEILAKETIRENPKNIVQFLSTLVDDLIAKRDHEKGGSSAEQDKLLKKGNRKNSYSFTDEELAASKIQAGFRGYKTRKSLKSKKKKAGSDLSLTTLTPFVQKQDEKTRVGETEEEALERKRLEKEVDEAIAAEIKTPLETIREESIDGSYRVKTPDVKFLSVDVVDVSSPKTKVSLVISPPSRPMDMADEILEELSEELHQINLQEIHANLSQELASNNLSLDDAKTESLELEVELQSSVDQQDEDIGVDLREEESDHERMEKHVIEVLNGQELGEDDPTSTSQSLGGTDVKGASLEIHESEVETMMLEEDSASNVEKVEDGESEVGMQISDNPETKMGEELEDQDGFLEMEGLLGEPEVDGESGVKEGAERESGVEKVMPLDVNLSTDMSEDISDSLIKDPPGEEFSNLHIEITTATPIENEPTSERSAQPETENVVNHSMEEISEKDGNSGNDKNVSEFPSLAKDFETDIAFIDEEKAEKIGEKKASNESAETNESEEKAGDITHQTGPNCPTLEKVDPESAVVDVEMSSLLQCTGASFANKSTDSASLSSSATTVRPPLSAFHKQEDSSQDASSLSESPAVVPRPKPRKPTSVSFEENKLSVEEPADSAASKLSSELLEESSSEVPQPVLRRQKSSPKTRGRAVCSKYRSGIVMDEEVSMEEMEAQIENDMLSQAATKIQAGFRGYKTRKTMGVSGGGKKKAKLMTPTSSRDEDALTSNATAADTIASSIAPTSDPAATPPQGSTFAPGSASADSLDYMTEEEKPIRPTLAYLRSRSYPGSREKDEDPRSRRSKPTSADGAAAAAGGASALDHPQGASTPELEYDPAYVNNAAIKIQASVRGFLVRKHSKRESRKPEKTGQVEQEQLNHQQAPIPRVQFDVGDLEHGDEAFIELPNHPDLPPSSYGVGVGELIINPAEDRAWRDSASPCSDVGSDVAATKIQAAFRGFKDRQKVRHAKKAVVTIQATVRGFLTRRRLMKLRRRSLQSRRRSSAKSMMSPEVQKIKKANDAATKIQAVYRGYQVRSKIRKVGSDDELN